jgi:hypothetical protein
MTRSPCTARAPCLTVASKSVDRLMRFRAESTALHSQSDQAVSVRRPLRRRFDTIARPARVRIRSRKPCTRARRRLFGWKVRLPFATTISSLHLASRSDPMCHPGRTRLPSRSLSRLGVSLVTGAGPAHIARIAAVSPTFGRLFEGTDERSPGQTFALQPSAPHRALTIVTPATPPASNVMKAPAMLQNRWRSNRKLVSFGQCRFRLERRPITKRGWRIGFLSRQPMLGVSSADLVCCRR